MTMRQSRAEWHGATTKGPQEIGEADTITITAMDGARMAMIKQEGRKGDGKVKQQTGTKTNPVDEIRTESRNTMPVDNHPQTETGTIHSLVTNGLELLSVAIFEDRTTLGGEVWKY